MLTIPTITVITTLTTPTTIITIITGTTGISAQFFQHCIAVATSDCGASDKAGPAVRHVSPRPSRLIAREQLGRRPLSRLVLKVDVRQLLPVSVAPHEARLLALRHSTATGRSGIGTTLLDYRSARQSLSASRPPRQLGHYCPLRQAGV
jgi:hypothetical protein